MNVLFISKSGKGVKAGSYTCLTMSLERFVMPPQMVRASFQRKYEVLVLKTSNNDSAKLVELNGVVRAKVMSGAPAGSWCNCITVKATIM